MLVFRGQGPELRLVPQNVDSNPVPIHNPKMLLDFSASTAKRLLSLLQESPQHFCPVSLLLLQFEDSEGGLFPGTPWVCLKWPGLPNLIVSTDMVLFHGGVMSFMPFMSCSS